jgi:hypothetical protein
VHLLAGLRLEGLTIGGGWESLGGSESSGQFPDEVLSAFGRLSRLVEELLSRIQPCPRA